MNPTQAHLICIRNGLKVYPEQHGYGHKICVELNGKKEMGKEVYRNPKDVNNAMERAVVYLANKL